MQADTLLKIQSIHQNGNNASLPNLKATTVFELGDIAYFIQSSPDVIHECSSCRDLPLADVY